MCFQLLSHTRVSQLTQPKFPHLTFLPFYLTKERINVMWDASETLRDHSERLTFIYTIQRVYICIKLFNAKFVKSQMVAWVDKIFDRTTAPRLIDSKMCILNWSKPKQIHTCKGSLDKSGINPKKMPNVSNFNLKLLQIKKIKLEERHCKKVHFQTIDVIQWCPMGCNEVPICKLLGN